MNGVQKDTVVFVRDDGSTILTDESTESQTVRVQRIWRNAWREKTQVFGSQNTKSFVDDSSLVIATDGETTRWVQRSDGIVEDVLSVEFGSEEVAVAVLEWELDNFAVQVEEGFGLSESSDLFDSFQHAFNIVVVGVHTKIDVWLVNAIFVTDQTSATWRK